MGARALYNIETLLYATESLPHLHTHITPQTVTTFVLKGLNVNSGPNGMLKHVGSCLTSQMSGPALNYFQTETRQYGLMKMERPFAMALSRQVNEEDS